jgi:hypothetical protein
MLVGAPLWTMTQLRDVAGLLVTVAIPSTPVTKAWLKVLFADSLFEKNTIRWLKNHSL